MNVTTVRKLSLKLFIGFLGLTALIAIISVLSGEFGELQLKILGTCFTISAASICSMSCAAFIEKHKRTALGLAGIALSIVTAILVIAGMWPEIEMDAYWKFTVTCGTCAVAFAHAFLLALPELDREHRWVQAASAVSIGVLAFLIILALWAEIDNEGFFRLLAVVSILVGLETLVVPILMKLRKGERVEEETLVLVKIGAERYRDATGSVYLVRPVADEPEPTEAADEPGPTAGF